MTSTLLQIDVAEYMHVIEQDAIEGISDLLAKVPPSEVGHVPLRSRSLLELQGLGASIWSGVDPVEYVRNLRDEWDR